MSKTDIRLLYQKDSGLQLETLTKFVEYPQTTIQVECDCPECDTAFAVEEGYHLDEDLIGYIIWLEEQLETSLSIGDLLLHEIARLTFQNTKLQPSNEKSNPGE